MKMHERIKQIQQTLQNMFRIIGWEKSLLLLLALGVLLFTSLPAGKEETKETKQSISASCAETTGSSDYERKLEERLSALIGRIDGAGEVSVMVVLEGSENKKVLKDASLEREETKEADGTGGSRNITGEQRGESTIMTKNAAGEQMPFVVNEQYPKVQGVAVVEQGAADPKIKQKIIELIKALFGIEINKIMVTA